MRERQGQPEPPWAPGASPAAPSPADRLPAQRGCCDHTLRAGAQKPELLKALSWRGRGSPNPGPSLPGLPRTRLGFAAAETSRSKWPIPYDVTTAPNLSETCGCTGKRAGRGVCPGKATLVQIGATPCPCLPGAETPRPSPCTGFSGYGWAVPGQPGPRPPESRCKCVRA